MNEKKGGEEIFCQSFVGACHITSSRNLVRFLAILSEHVCPGGAACYNSPQGWDFKSSHSEEEDRGTYVVRSIRFRSCDVRQTSCEHVRVILFGDSYDCKRV